MVAWSKEKKLIWEVDGVHFLWDSCNKVPKTEWLKQYKGVS